MVMTRDKQQRKDAIEVFKRTYTLPSGQNRQKTV